ncbi:branched-chain amino acid ABC transporter permease [Tumidithrix elongata RA019]|uniref:Branched-chain amino acid ABC transporter permease n=1 Tax=Tumidithrix elongata BACA0141 TaxID=2716417 RepID=A0AAW9PQ42_9CYAN|nr:branched-chain amino acid ABC transporter permease [Tumidithrix elongata RA019]
MLEILQSSIDGIAVGSIIALAAVGLTLTYGILRLANFAHGDILTLGAYLAFFANTVMKIDIWLSILFGCLVAIAFVLVCEKILWSPLRARRVTPTTMMIVSIGLALVVRNAVVLIWGASPQKYNLPTFPAINLWGMLITRNRIVVIVAAIAVIAGLYYLLQNTKIGRAMRAVADNPELARVTGINVDAVILWTWVIAGGLTALGGTMYGLITNLRPNMGWFLVLPMFASVILGGIGNPYGAIAGALIIGIAQEVATTCPASLGELSKYCIGTDYKLGVGLLIMILVLLFKPQGLFKGTM